MALNPPYVNDAEAGSKAQSVFNNNRPVITAEIDNKISLVSTGIRTASTSTVISGDTQIYVLSAAGTYTNLGGIVVSSGDLAAGQVQARLIDGVWTKYIAPPPGLDAYATNEKVDPLVAVIDGGDFSAGLSDSTFTTELSSAGTRASAQFFSTDGVTVSFQCWFTKVGITRLKLFKPTENAGEYIQYWEQNLTVSAIGNTTFVSGVDFPEQQVFAGGFVAFYNNVSTGSGATAKVGAKTQTPGGYIIATTNTPNGTLTTLSNAGTFLYGVKVNYKVNSIQDRLEELEAQSAGGENLKDAIAQFEGDSIVEGTGTTMGFPFILAEKFSMATPLIKAKSGTGLVKPNGGSPGMVNRVDTWEDEANIDAHVFWGMFNDITSTVNGNANGLPIGSITDRGTEAQPDLFKTTSVYGAIDWILNYAVNKYPTIPIVWIIPTPRNQQSSVNQPMYGTYKSDGVSLCQTYLYAKAIKERCAERNIPCLDLYQGSSLRPWLAANNSLYFDSADGVHPNNKGHQVIADILSPFFIQYIYKKKI